MNKIPQGVMSGVINDLDMHAIPAPDDPDTFIIDQISWAKEPFQLRVWLPPEDLKEAIDEARRGDLEPIWPGVAPEEAVKNILLVHFREFEEDLMDMDDLNITARWSDGEFYNAAESQNR